MKLKDWLDDLRSVVSQSAWIRGGVGVATLAVSAVSTYHRIDGVTAIQAPAEPEGSRAPASFSEVSPSAPVLEPLVGTNKSPISAVSRSAVSTDDSFHGPEPRVEPGIQSQNAISKFLQNVGASPSANNSSKSASISSWSQNTDGSFTVSACPGCTVTDNPQGFNPSPTSSAAPVASTNNTTSGTTASNPTTTASSSPTPADDAFIFSSVGFIGAASASGNGIEVSAGPVTGGTDPILEDE